MYYTFFLLKLKLTLTVYLCTEAERYILSDIIILFFFFFSTSPPFSFLTLFPSSPFSSPSSSLDPSTLDIYLYLTSLSSLSSHALILRADERVSAFFLIRFIIFFFLIHLLPLLLPLHFPLNIIAIRSSPLPSNHQVHSIDSIILLFYSILFYSYHLSVMPPRTSLTSSFSVTDTNNEVVCPLKNNDSSNCRKRCIGVSSNPPFF